MAYPFNRGWAIFMFGVFIMARRFIKTYMGFSYRTKDGYSGGVVARCDTCNKFISWKCLRYGLPKAGVCHKDWITL